MSATTDEKKLNGQGLGWVWARVRTLVSNLASVVETNRVKIVGNIASVSPTSTFAANSIVRVDKETYMNTSSIVGAPSHVVIHNNAVVTHNGEAVTHGTNSLSTWVKVGG